MFQAKASKERLDVVRSLMACKPKPEASICAFVLEMKGYFDRLESLNMVFDTDLSINIILSGLPVDYNQFVLLYQMNRKKTSIIELHSLLQTAKQGIKKSDVPSTSAALVLTVGQNAKKRKTSHSNWKGKATQGKSDRGSKRKVKSDIAPTSDPKEAVCFYRNTKGHWKRSCPKYLKDEKVEKGVHSGMYIIELHNTTTSDSWVLDTWCGTHICAVLHGLKESRRLKHGELNLIIRNRKITPVTRIGKFELMLKSGVRINLNNCCYSSEMTRNIISFLALFKDGIYKIVKCISNDGNMILNVGSSNELDKSKLWHSRLRYVNKKRIAQLQKDEVLESFDFKLDDVCESCLLGKMTKSPFTGTCERVFKRYQNEVENQMGRKIKLTPPRTPQLNGVAERRNRILLDMVRSMMCRATLLINLWGYALETAAHILNLVPTKKVSKTPFEIWKGKRPSLGHIKIWGCEVFVRRETQDKLEARSEKYLFIGYPEESFGYLLYKPKDNVVFVARRGVFLEREMISKEDSGSKIDLEEIQESGDEEPIINTDTQQEVVTPVEPDDISLPIRRTSSRVSKPSQDPQFYYGFHIEKDKIVDSTLTEVNELANYKEAMASLEAAKWKEAMKSDIQFMYDNQVWNLVDTTPGLKTVGCKRTFKKKTDMDGKVHTYKARIMLTIAAFHDYEIWQMDVKTAFLNEKLTEDVFMAQPEGFEKEKDMEKCLIGLSQDTYLDKILKRFRMENSKKGNLPLHHGIKINVKNILRYLRNTKDRFFVYGGEKELKVTGYCDTSWQTNKDDSRSQSGWVFLLNGGAVTWKGSKQDTVADFTCEFEYIAACEASKEAIWMKNFIGDLGVVPTVQDPIEILCDNESAVALTKEPKDHGKSKHIERKYYFVRSKVEEGHVIVKDILSEDNPVDLFTKALAKSKHDEHARSI
uniref:Integrase catalytic domain-containing protein n=1 Tax=Tanacetum cinerariifolium TaxID=118510 RepID=A0A6L2K8A8_TANCI|nr:hypothetical protein [Tanacetum cinerariifolium]